MKSNKNPKTNLIIMKSIGYFWTNLKSIKIQEYFLLVGDLIE